MYRNADGAAACGAGKARQGRHAATSKRLRPMSPGPRRRSTASPFRAMRIERISDVVLPGSSLIISDEGASIETGKDTDFVVLMSGEPQGGIKARRREPRYRNDDFFGGSPFGGLFWN